MSENSGISVKAAILYGLAIIVVAFVGVVLGNWFVQWRQASNVPPRPTLGDWPVVNKSLLNPGERFPSEELLDMDSNTVMMDSVIAGRNTLVLLLSPGCEPCAVAIDDWKEEAESLPRDLLVICLAGGDLADIRAYRSERDIPFPLYCDPYMVYTQQYDLVIFPTVVGVNNAGQVALVWHGYGGEHGLADYYGAITNFVSAKKED
jgi:peroxiredoxin